MLFDMAAQMKTRVVNKLQRGDKVTGITTDVIIRGRGEKKKAAVLLRMWRKKSFRQCLYLLVGGMEKKNSTCFSWNFLWSYRMQIVLFFFLFRVVFMPPDLTFFICSGTVWGNHAICWLPADDCSVKHTYFRICRPARLNLWQNVSWNNFPQILSSQVPSCKFEVICFVHTDTHLRKTLIVIF